MEPSYRYRAVCARVVEAGHGVATGPRGHTGPAGSTLPVSCSAALHQIKWTGEVPDGFRAFVVAGTLYVMRD